MTNLIMQDYQLRVIEEKTALDEKIVKLKDFIRSNPAFESLQQGEKSMMEYQLHVMKEYSRALEYRIHNFRP